MTPSPSRRTVLVLGAAGRFGVAATRAFATAGWHVVAQVRRPMPSPPPAGVEWLQADPATLAREPGCADVVVHAVNPPYTRWGREALPVLTLSLAIAERRGAHFMLPGNVYNFGAAMPALLDGATPQRPTTGNGAIRVAMEALIAERVAAGRLTASVVRAGDFFGGGTGNWFDEAIVKSLARGRLVYPGPLDLPHAWAYLPDLARAFVRIADRPRAATLDDWPFAGHTLTGRQLLDAIEAAARTLGIEPAGGFRRGSLPWPAIRAIGVVLPTWRELARISYLWRVPHALDGRRYATLPGAAAGHTPLPVALGAALLDLGIGRAGAVRAAATDAGATHPAA